jgi:hypothetical protein
MPFSCSELRENGAQASPRTTTMKATEVRIQKALDPGESYVDPAFVLVETVFDESGDTVTSIEHVTSAVVGNKVRWKVITIGQSVPMSHAGALEWAVSFAASRNIGVVYQRDDSRTMPYAAASRSRVTAAPRPSK